MSIKFRRFYRLWRRDRDRQTAEGCCCYTTRRENRN